MFENIDVTGITLEKIWIFVSGAPTDVWFSIVR